MDFKIHGQSVRPAWYAGGLRFGCQACGACCGGAPGYVWVDDEDIARISGALGVAPIDFSRTYVRSLWRGKSLREKTNYDCVLLEGGGHCAVYEVRPLQCRTWPFWESNLATREAWQEAARRCPGIGKGPVYRIEQIEALVMEMKI
jgi:uncharacterized protein